MIQKIACVLQLSYSQYFSACDGGKYGKECKNTCGECMEQEDCFHINGTCLNGCASGYQEFLCNRRMYTIFEI